MGRGRAKAKQIKVARKLKYYSPDTDLSALQRELGAESAVSDDDDFSMYADTYNDVDEDDDGTEER